MSTKGSIALQMLREWIDRLERLVIASSLPVRFELVAV